MEINKDRVKVISAGLGMSIIFGLSFLFTKNALDFVSPIEFLSFRFLVSSLSMIFLLILGVIKIAKKPYHKLIPLIIFQPGLYFIFENFGVKLIPVSESGIIISTIPIFVALLSHFILKEKTLKIQYLFISLSLVGVFLIMGVNSIKGNFLGDFLMFMAVLCASLFNIQSRKLSVHFKPSEITFFMMISGTIFYNILYLSSFDFNYSNILIPEVLTSALYLGILSSTVTFFLINYMLSKVTAVESSIFANLTTVITVLAGFFFRGEEMYWYYVVGMILIILGVWGVNYFGAKHKKKIQNEKLQSNMTMR
ncbi:DMT family transporter [Geotoga petraea]|uniref:EamA/RhaT family transporter n=1 Tax=Geotoga petraea TaxID=28234 RepID=A0A4Z0W4W0_9BACT|nr:EamA family transporter [Geotoga petraea]TGG88358.1 EamA/RhaT family transporter [Geotoga petraea]